MTNRFGKRMRISNGMSYTCLKCSKRWNINSIINIKGVNKMIINHNQKPYRRNAGHCSCGVAFDIPSININILTNRYNDSTQQRVIQ